MYGFWGAILLIAMLSNMFNSLWNRRASRSVSDVEGSQGLTASAKRNPLITTAHWLRTNLIIPSVFGTKHRQLYYGFTVPTRMETIIIGLFWSISVILSSINFRTFEGNL
jgi:hypothetical protein